jgi:hypothetical protein
MATKYARKSRTKAYLAVRPVLARLWVHCVTDRHIHTNGSKCQEHAIDLKENLANTCGLLPESLLKEASKEKPPERTVRVSST